MDGFPLCSIDDVIERARGGRTGQRTGSRFRGWRTSPATSSERSHRRLSPCLRGTGAPSGLADGPRADAPHRAAGRAAASDRHALAAVVEHVSELHEIEPPGWIQEPERFVDIPDFFMLGWHRDLETAVYAPASFIPHGALTNARPRRARRTACLDPRITAGSESFSMSCRRRSKRAACAATSTSSAAHRLRPRLPRRRRTGCGHVYLVVVGGLSTGYGGDRTRKDVGVRIDETKDEVLGRGENRRRAPRTGRQPARPRGGAVRAARRRCAGEDRLQQPRNRRHRRLGRVPAGDEGIRGAGAGPTGHQALGRGAWHRRGSDAIRICERAYPGWVVMEKTRRESTGSPTGARNAASRCPS